MKNYFHRILNLFPTKKELRKTMSHFSKREYYVFLVLAIILFVSTLSLLQNINNSFMTKIPMKGGSISEGVVGTPRFVNPVLAFSDTDQDLVSLIYSGLMRKDTNGELIPDLASSYKISSDGLSYTFVLADNAYFHNGDPITTNDIIFTIEKVKDPIIKSPKKGSWDGISVEQVDEKTIRFTLKQHYASFLENTTLGILPKKVWESTPIELNDANINPIGSGPYEISKTGKQSSGLIDFYDLSPFDDFILGKPYLQKISLHFYANEEDMISALEKGAVSQISSITPDKALALREKGYRIESLTLPRVFGLFFNQSQNQIFTNKNVVRAIDIAIDKQKIIDRILLGYGVVIDGPTPPSILSYQNSKTPEDITPQERTAKAEDLLSKDGWKKNDEGILEKTVLENKKKVVKNIEFSISTGNAPELADTANLIKEDLGKLGIKVEVKTFEIGNLNQSVIRPRKYDALLFGEIVNHESDLFAFWHSSQRKDPGLNVAMYTNAKVDKILEEAFITTDEEARVKKYSQFESEIKQDLGAIFLYSPDFIYVVSKDLEGFSFKNIVSPANRFLNSYLWYTKTDNVWKIFSNN